MSKKHVTMHLSMPHYTSRAASIAGANRAAQRTVTQMRSVTGPLADEAHAFADAIVARSVARATASGPKATKRDLDAFDAATERQVAAGKAYQTAMWDELKKSPENVKLTPLVRDPNLKG